MTNEKIYGYIDHTLLKATATWAQIKTLCDEAVKYHTASVCIPPAYISRVRKEYGESFNICTVIGFPLGYNTTPVKAFEAEDAIRKGADEIDMVINIGDVKNGEFDKVEEEIKAVKAACGNHILKVIIETCYLTEQEKISLCRAVTNAGADFIKTSTGFGSAGATIEDINLFKANIGENVRMKAAGGIKSKADIEMFIEAGCERIGTSSAIKILTGEENKNEY